LPHIFSQAERNKEEEELQIVKKKEEPRDGARQRQTWSALR